MPLSPVLVPLGSSQAQPLPLPWWLWPPPVWPLPIPQFPQPWVNLRSLQFAQDAQSAINQLDRTKLGTVAQAWQPCVKRIFDKLSVLDSGTDATRVREQCLAVSSDVRTAMQLMRGMIVDILKPAGILQVIGVYSADIINLLNTEPTVRPTGGIRYLKSQGAVGPVYDSVLDLSLHATYPLPGFISPAHVEAVTLDALSSIDVMMANLATHSTDWWEVAKGVGRAIWGGAEVTVDAIAEVGTGPLGVLIFTVGVITSVTSGVENLKESAGDIGGAIDK